MEALGAVFFFCLFSISNSQNGQCQNGGTYDGIKCLCTENYYGQYCEFSLHTDFCMQTAPAGYKQFYFPYFNHTSNKLLCVTHCTQGVPGAIDCNHGECQLLTTGPQCYCSEPNMYWYSGERCNSRVNKLILGGVLALILLVMLIIIITLSVLLYKAKRRRY